MISARFTFDWYLNLVKLLKAHGYEYATYDNWHLFDRCVILRHDIDTDLNKALQMAVFESGHKIQSTYFVMLTSDFYNTFSSKNFKTIQNILSLGHEIGLHFDETRYREDLGIPQLVKERIICEVRLLSTMFSTDIHTISMHRPSKEILESNLEIHGLINCYGQTYFKDFKYLSDSRRNWREPVEDVIVSEKYQRIQLLTHPFWYHEREKNMKDTVMAFLQSAQRDRYYQMNENFTALDEIVSKDEII